MLYKGVYERNITSLRQSIFSYQPWNVPPTDISFVEIAVWYKHRMFSLDAVVHWRLGPRSSGKWVSHGLMDSIRFL